MIIDFLKFASSISLWDLLTYSTALIGTVITLIVVYKRKHSSFSLYVSYSFGTGHSLYPNVIYFTARNLADSPIVVCRPNFKSANHFVVDDTAHGNVDTMDYELKFRQLSSSYTVVKGYSYATILLRHRESAVAYLPIGRDYNEASLLRFLKKRPIGWVTFDIITIGEGRPKVVRIKQKVKRVVREHRLIGIGDSFNSIPHPTQNINDKNT